nr:hybrid sensor histidine kinase/response regulator [uncultured Rhodopila sp.]
MTHAVDGTAPASTDATDTSLHVLVVDDEPIIREEIAEFLQMHGIRAEAVSNGETALQNLDADLSIDVMLSDIRMPGMDGLTLAKTAIERRGEQHAIEVVMLTGHATVNDAAASARLRAIDFLVKPLSFTTLRATLLHAHESARNRREKWQQNRALEAVYGDTVKQVGNLQSLVTELQQALTEPRHADDGGRNAFLSVVNHELRTPLVPIIGLAELIELGSESIDPGELRSLAHEIRLGGERLERAMSRITTLADLIAGRAKAHPVACRPDQVIEKLRQHFATRAAERGQTLNTAGESVRTIVTDKSRLQQVLEELLDNASRFSPPGAAIALSAADDRDGVTFRVADTGPGMSSAEVELAGRAFQQIDMSTTRRVDGLGIGLPIAMRLAALIGASLTVASEPGHGTAVSLHLPAGTAQAKPS